MKKKWGKVLTILMTLSLLHLSFSCASLSNYLVPPFNQQKLRPDPASPGVFIFNHLDLDHPEKCGFLKLFKCYVEMTDRYDTKDPTTWLKFVSGGWVLQVREQPK